MNRFGFRSAVAEFNSVDNCCEYRNRVNLYLMKKAIKYFEKQR